MFTCGPLPCSRFTRILGTLLHNGIPILQALRISKDSTGNRVLSSALIDTSSGRDHHCWLAVGDSLTAPLTACKFFPRDVVEMIAVGEESNNLDKVLIDVANGLEKRTSRAVLEPGSHGSWSRRCFLSWRLLFWW